MLKNFILNTDSYKASHYAQYPKDTLYVSSYIESRGGKFDNLLFFGLQIFLKKYLSNPISNKDIKQAEYIFKTHGLPFHKDGWKYILDKYNGYLPLEISAVKEGTVLPTNNVLLQVINTDPKCFWLTSYIETALLRAIWYPTTVATVSFHCKKIIKSFLEETADSIDSLAFKLHDFGARGVSSLESAAIGGVAHMVNFMGSDTISGICAANEYYNEPMAAYSIPAAEHSTIITWGKENELQAYKNMLDQFSGKNKLVAIVSDSYDLWNAIENIWCGKLYEKVKNNGGTIVIRPDSGDPVHVVCTVIEKLMNKFGYITNQKGYKVLPDFIRIIQGDGICLEVINKILVEMKRLKFSAENITFGMGGALLQQVNRDTLKFAMKVSAIKIKDKWHKVNKEPITDLGKKSKAGRLALIKKNDKFKTIDIDNLNNNENYLIPVFKNGKILSDLEFKNIRSESELYLI